MPGVRPHAAAATNAVHHLVERWRGTGCGGAAAVADDDGSWSFDHLSRATARAGGALRARGVVPGERVAVVLPDGRAAAQALLGAMRIGAIAVPLDPARPDVARAAIDDCGARIVVDDPGLLDTGAPAPLAAVRPDDPAFLIYTSGTTGHPKGVVHAHGTLAPAGPSFLRDVVGVGPGDRCHAAARIPTALGFFIGLARPLAAGATAVLTAYRTSPRRTIDLVSEHGVTVLAGVPALWAQIASVLRRDAHGARRLAALRTSLSSGDRMPAGLAEEMAGLGCHLVDALGSSECGDVYLSESGDGRGVGLLRRATPGVALRGGGAGAAPLWVRTPCAALGYWGRPELTARLRHGAWTRTEDVVVRECGGYRLLGRADDLFKVGGRLVSPLEIERALAEHPLIAEAAVVGTPQRGGLTRPAAFVVRAAGGRGLPAGLERELQRLVARRLAPDLAPGRVAAMATLPRLAGGKLDRRALGVAAAAASLRAPVVVSAST